MSSPLHSKQTISDGIHSPIAYTYLSASARTSAVGFDPEDLYKLSRQLDDGSTWQLIQVSPPQWQLFINSGSVYGDIAASYLVLNNTASLVNERAFTIGTGLVGVDGGSNSTYTVSINNNIVATVSGTRFTGPVSASGGLTGSLQQVSPGLSYLVAGQSIIITSQSNGQIVVASTATGGGDPNPSYLVLSNTASLSNERAFTVGTGLSGIDAGANSTYTLAINNNVVATVSGTTFTGNVSLGGNAITSVDSITFVPLSTGSVTPAEGKIYYNSDDGALTVFSDIPNVSLQVGQEMYVRVRNNSGATIENGKVVYLNGSLGYRPTIALATNLIDVTSHVLGVATVDILNGDDGYVTTFGYVRDIDTSAFSAGDELYLGSTTGSLVNVVPTGSGSITQVAVCIRSHPNFGIIFVDIQGPSHLSELHDVYDAMPTSGSYLRADGTWWRASNFVADVLGIVSSSAADVNASYLVLSNTASLSNERALTIGTGLIGTDAGANSTYTLAINNNVVATVTGTRFTGPVSASGGLTGSLQQVSPGIPYLVGGPNITVTTQSNGQVVVSTSLTQGADNFATYVVVSTTASLSNERALTAGGGIAISDGGAGGNITVSNTRPGDLDATYLVLSSTASLSNERTFTAGTGLVATDAGANSTYTLGINNNVVATVSGTRFTGPVNASGGLTGSLQQTSGGLSYLVGGNAINVVSQSNGQITIAANLSGTVSHSLLLGLQGGSGSQHYHLDYEHWNLVTNGPTGELNGFLNRNSTNLAWNNSTRTLTLSLAVGTSSFTVYEYGGGIYTYTGSLASTINSYTSGTYWFYIYSGSLLNAAVAGPTNLFGFKTSLVAALYVNNGLTGTLADERHGSVMDWRTHEYLHKTVNTRYEKGFDLTQLTTGNGGVDTDAQLSLTIGTIWDEDIDINVTRAAIPSSNFEQELGSSTTIAGRFPIMYRSGTGPDNWVTIEPTNFPIFQNSAGQRVVYNNDPGSGFWQATQISSNNNYAIVWLIATDYISGSVRSIIGQGDYATLPDAQAASFSSLVLGNFPSAEIKLLYRLIYQTSTGKGNTIKANIADVTDYRQVSSLPGSGFASISHSSLSGLTSPNAHPASAISVVTTTFTGSNSVLTSSDGDLQSALNSIAATAASTLGATFTGAVRFNAGLSGSLTKLTDGSSYIVAGTNINVTTASNGQVQITSLTTPADLGATYLVISNTASLNAERALTIGTGLIGTDAGANSTYTLAINNNVVATVSGTRFTGPVSASGGLSGSLQQVAPGIPYLVGGPSITVTTQSNGQIVIGTTLQPSADNFATYVVITTTASLPNERALTAGGGIAIADGGAGGNVTISNTRPGDLDAQYLVLATTASLSSERTFTPGTGLAATDAGANSTYTLAINNNVVATVSGTRFTGPISASGGLSGSLQLIAPGLTYLVAGQNISIVSQSNGQVIIASSATGGGDPNPSYLVLSNTASLPNERAFTAGAGLVGTDAGANSTYTLAINNNVVATVSGTTFTGPISASGGLTGSLQLVGPGLSYLVAGNNVTITSQSNGQVVIASTGGSGGSGDPNATYLVLSNTASLNAERALTIGTGLAGTDAGANSTYTLAINNNVVATVSGTTFTGPVTLSVAGGMTGSNTRISSTVVALASSYTSGINIVTASNNQVQFSINNNVVATVSGTRFTGPVSASGGLTGSLQQVSSGIPYLITSGSLRTSSGSNGQITLFTPPRTAYFEFSLTEDVSNTERYFYAYRSAGNANQDAQRSGNNTGIQNADACSPIQIPFNGRIVEAILTLKGAGVQNGSVTYPVTYQTTLFQQQFTAESSYASINFSISNAFTVGTYSVGSTNFSGSVGLNIDVNKGQLFGLKFINGNSASLVGQTRNAFVTLIVEER